MRDRFVALPMFGERGAQMPFGDGQPRLERQRGAEFRDRPIEVALFRVRAPQHVVNVRRLRDDGAKMDHRGVALVRVGHHLEAEYERDDDQQHHRYRSAPHHDFSRMRETRRMRM